MSAILSAIEIYLPEQVETNADLERQFPLWRMKQIGEKTGIQQRHRADSGQCASDLAAAAAERLFASGACRREQVDFVLFCTQTPDYFLPTTACLLQSRLQLSPGIGALDFNLGCSGFIYGLSLAAGLVHSGQARNILLLTADTYTKLVDGPDRNVKTLFGDAAAATLVQHHEEGTGCAIGPFVFGTDGSGAENLIVRGGAFRHPTEPPILKMNGPEIFQFSLRVVPPCLEELAQRASLRLDEIDLFVPHQANRYMLEHLRDKMEIPAEKFFIGMENCGNTVSSSIPIALHQLRQQGKVLEGNRIALVGFGVGYSWGGCLLR
ncbi:MAG: ketoacyl-ACP synthase III [Chthoniobacter sp.]